MKKCSPQTFKGGFRSRERTGWAGVEVGEWWPLQLGIQTQDPVNRVYVCVCVVGDGITFWSSQRWIPKESNARVRCPTWGSRT